MVPRTLRRCCCQGDHPPVLPMTEAYFIGDISSVKCQQVKNGHGFGTRWVPDSTVVERGTRKAARWTLARLLYRDHLRYAHRGWNLRVQQRYETRVRWLIVKSNQSSGATSIRLHPWGTLTIRQLKTSAEDESTDRRPRPNPPIDGARTAEGGKGVTSAMMGA